MLHLESGWTLAPKTRQQAQTEGYDGVLRREFVVRKGHATSADRHLANQCPDFKRLTLEMPGSTFFSFEPVGADRLPLCDIRDHWRPE